MRSIERHNLVNIGAKDQPLPYAGILDLKRHGDEGDIVDGDAAAFCRRHQPVLSVRIALDHPAEEANQRHAMD